jgi:hypothetical protein
MQLVLGVPGNNPSIRSDGYIVEGRKRCGRFAGKTIRFKQGAPGRIQACPWRNTHSVPVLWSSNPP